MTRSVTTADELRQRLGRFGIFAVPARMRTEPAVLARAIERAGFASAWIGGSNATPADFDVLHALLAATERLVVATGIVNIWAWDAAQLKQAAAGLEARFPGRFILGLGVSHQRVVEGLGHAYERPLAKMEKFLGELDHPAEHGADEALPPVVLAALARVSGDHGF